MESPTIKIPNLSEEDASDLARVMSKNRIPCLSKRIEDTPLWNFFILFEKKDY